MLSLLRKTSSSSAAVSRIRHRVVILTTVNHRSSATADQQNVLSLAAPSLTVRAMSTTTTSSAKITSLRPAETMTLASCRHHSTVSQPSVSHSFSVRTLHSTPPLVLEPAAETPAAAAATTDASPPAAAAADSSSSLQESQPTTTEYSTPELTRDAAAHKAGLADPDRPFYQNPLHHNNPDMDQMFREDFDSQEAFEAAQQPAPPLNDDAPAYLQEMADEIVNLTLLEMNELVNKIAQHYGFHEGMLSPEDGGGGAAGADDDEEGAVEAAPAKTAFDLKLVSFDDKAKIKIIKEVRAIAGLGLKEAKEMVEGAPKVVLKQIKQEQADEIKAKLEELGAVIDIV